MGRHLFVLAVLTAQAIVMDWRLTAISAGVGAGVGVAYFLFVPPKPPRPVLPAAETDSPIVRLVNAIVLSAVRKGASAIHIHDARVDFELDGTYQIEMEPPALLHPFIVRRVIAMANLPQHGAGQHATGVLQLRIPDPGATTAQLVTFDVEVGGHGPELYAILRVTAPRVSTPPADRA